MPQEKAGEARDAPVSWAGGQRPAGLSSRVPRQGSWLCYKVTSIVGTTAAS